METGWVWGRSGMDMHLAASEGCMVHGGVLITPYPFALLVLYVVAYLRAGSITKPFGWSALAKDLLGYRALEQELSGE